MKVKTRCARASGSEACEDQNSLHASSSHELPTWYVHLPARVSKSKCRFLQNVAEALEASSLHLSAWLLYERRATPVLRSHPPTPTSSLSSEIPQPLPRCGSPCFSCPSVQPRIPSQRRRAGADNCRKLWGLICWPQA